MQSHCALLIQSLHSYAKERQISRAVVELNGSLDSCLTFYIAVRAFGPKNVTALMLPEVGKTNPDEMDRAKMLIDYFGARSHYQTINNFMVDFHFTPWKPNQESLENLKHRVRSLLTQNYAESEKALHLGSANRSQIRLGLGDQNGLFAGSLLPLGDLYQSELVKLASDIGLPNELIEFGLPQDWKQTDDILKKLESGEDPDALISMGLHAHLVHRIARLLEENHSTFKHLPTLPAGQIRDLLQNAQAAEAESV